MWVALIDERSRQSVDVTERALVGLASTEELAQAVAEARAAHAELAAEHERDHSVPGLGACNAAFSVVATVANGFHQDIFARVRDSIIFCRESVEQGFTKRLGTEFARAFRDIFGNPFRPVTFAPEWRTDTAIALAQTMYESRDFGAMPILADALQDAGCDSDEVLNHCRDAAQVHVRGCWVVELLLNKV